MDRSIEKIIQKRKNYGKDHELKYLEFKTLWPNKVAMLREVVESACNAKQKAIVNEIINYIHESLTEVVKDSDGFIEGSKLRNTLDEYIAYIDFKERECQDMLLLTKRLNNDLRRRSTQ